MITHTSALAPDPTPAPVPGPEALPLGFAACGLDGRPQNVSRARRFVLLTLEGWVLPSLAGDLELVVTELVTNAVRHALGCPDRAVEEAEYPVWLGLSLHPRHLVAAVTDPSPEPPRPRPVDDLGTGGRGMHLIEALSDTWSWTPAAPRGKTVWAALLLPTARS
ncbi:ATP-binding protein [Streptomyces sp. NPDC093600]|uniref:ATP-binding protein n=1 Tax=Streptomyces sp. NPDC093600 TaxID=3366047 RepID=UPI0038306ADE